MRTFRLFAVSVFLAATFAVSAFAQTTPTTGGKIGLIDTSQFYDPTNGIKKLVTAVTTLQTEFKPVTTELQTLETKIQALQKEIQDLQAKLNDPNNKVPIPPATVNAKLEEYDKVTRDYKFKKEGAEAQAQRREAAVLGPVRQDIGNAIQEFTKKNGYVLILDISKDNIGIILGLDEGADVTKQFITFYNTRPATTATVTK